VEQKVLLLWVNHADISKIISVDRYHFRKNVISNHADISKIIMADRSPQPSVFFELDLSLLPNNWLSNSR
jgi:hypothetical protein